MKSTLPVLTLIAACLASTSAFAFSPSLQECAADDDCGVNEICAIEEFDCAPCPEGEDCPPCASGAVGYCFAPPEPIPSCDSDADCANEDVCVSYTYESCAGRDVVFPCDAEADEPCEMTPIMDEECESYSEAYCVPPYFAPCQADADCGPGFLCKGFDVCTCSSESPDEDGDGAPDCNCEPSGEMYCELIPVACESDVECPSGLECISERHNDLPVEIVGDADASSDSTATQELTSFCAPDDYGNWATPTTADKDANSVGTGAERVNWGATDADGSKPQAGCTTTGTPSALGFLGMFGLVVLRLRRRK